MYLREIEPHYLEKKILSGTERGVCFRSRMWPRICPTIFLPEATGSLYIWEVAETHLLNGKGLREEQEENRGSATAVGDGMVWWLGARTRGQAP